MKVTLPWPDKRLNPNARLHWRNKARINAKAREGAFWLSMEQMQCPFDIKPDGVVITFYPPDKRVRDKDNMISSIKGAKDGVADAIKWDDRHWDEQYVVATSEKPGKVTIEFIGE